MFPNTALLVIENVSLSMLDTSFFILAFQVIGFMGHLRTYTIHHQIKLYFSNELSQLLTGTSIININFPLIFFFFKWRKKILG